MIRLQNAEFKTGEVIVSIGFFKTETARQLMKERRPQYVEAYDPNRGVYKAYESLAAECKNFMAYDRAVSDKAGEAVLMGRSYNSTICVRPGAKMPSQYKIKVVAFDDVIRSVFKRFGRVDRVVLNCEGAEIPIIRQAETLDLCKYIFVQFHTFVDTLAVDKSDVDECLAKLGRTHKMELITKSRTEYEGYRI